MLKKNLYWSLCGNTCLKHIVQSQSNKFLKNKKKKKRATWSQDRIKYIYMTANLGTFWSGEADNVGVKETRLNITKLKKRGRERESGRQNNKQKTTSRLGINRLWLPLEKQRFVESTHVGDRIWRKKNCQDEATLQSSSETPIHLHLELSNCC